MAFFHAQGIYVLREVRNTTKDRHRALGVGLLWGPRLGRFLMSEVPLKRARGATNDALPISGFRSQRLLMSQVPL